MGNTVDDLAKGLLNAVDERHAKETKAYDTSAEIRNIKDGVAWVHIPGGIDETPVALTINAQVGDRVQVRVAGGRAWITGNATNPPTDDTRANMAYGMATDASELSAIAAQAATDAQVSAMAANGHAKDAETAANTAQSEANKAAYAADTASKGLSLVEDIVGVLELVQRNGRYERTNDEEPLQDKWYFTRTGSGTTEDPYQYAVSTNVAFQYVLTTDTQIIQDKPYYTRSGSGTEEDPYLYTLVENPVVEEIDTYYENTRWNYFELIGIDEAIQNYVSSHLVFVNGVLSLKNGGTEVALSTNAEQGLTFYNNGTQVAQYGSSAVVGNPSGFHITITANYNNTGKPRLSFYRDSINEVAYISGDKLYITQSVVLQQMDVGEKQIDGGLGQWSWKVHEVNGQNNLYLKWLG